MWFYYNLVSLIKNPSLFWLNLVDRNKILTIWWNLTFNQIRQKSNTFNKKRHEPNQIERSNSSIIFIIILIKNKIDKSNQLDQWQFDY